LRQELHLVTNGTAEVVEGFTDVGRVVVGFIRILGSGLTV
jgi:hypothetical protein